MGKHIKNHLDTLDNLDALLDSMKGQGYSVNEINQTVINRCFIEMNGILACIADSLEAADTKKGSTVNEDKIVESYDLLCCDKGTYFRFIYSDHTWEYSNFMLPRVYINHDDQDYSPEEDEMAYLFCIHNPKTVDEYKIVLTEGGFEIEPFDYKKEVGQDGKVQ